MEEKYVLLLDILREHEDKQYKLKKTIKALKTNPSYRALFPKDYLKKKEEEKKKIDTVIEALNNFRHTKR